MTAEEYLRQGQLSECLGALQAQVRQQPAESKHRVFLFQLLSVLGQWERALTQVNVAAEMDPKCAALAQIYGPALQTEALRKEVFAGRRTPLVFGEPESWIGSMIQANQLSADRKHAAAQELRSQALEQAPATGGTIDGKPFEWIADADGRLGPMLELILNGKYYWVPFNRITQIELDAPTDLRDLVWLPAHVQWTNGGQAVALVPARYPGSEASESPAIRLARKTEWISNEGDVDFGLGQRLLATDESDHDLLATRSIRLGPQPPDSDLEAPNA